MLKTNIKAPGFEALDQAEISHNLDDYKGQWLLLYFYPKDDTPGCTKEACGLRDSYQEFKKQKIAVLGVSSDSVTKHQKFAEKYSLPFPLLSDPDQKIIKSYEAWGIKKFMGRSYEGILRVSYLIDSKGKIARAYPKVKPEEHAKEILADFSDLNKQI